MTDGKSKRGRKAVSPDEKMVQRVVTFDNVTAMHLAIIGDGNVSLGIRRATEIVWKQMREAEEVKEIEERNRHRRNITMM